MKNNELDMKVVVDGDYDIFKSLYLNIYPTLLNSVLKIENNELVIEMLSGLLKTIHRYSSFI